MLSKDLQDKAGRRISLKGLLRPLTKNDERFTRPVELWCRNCREKTITTETGLSHLIDRNPRWTVGDKRPLYIQRRAGCKGCSEDEEKRFSRVCSCPIQYTINI
jgi:hypothetical protein